MIRRVQVDEIQRGRTSTWTEALEIPPLPPSRLKGCKLITTQYLLQVGNLLHATGPPVGTPCYLMQVGKHITGDAGGHNTLSRAGRHITNDTGGHSTLSLTGRHNTSLMVKMDTVHYLLQAETSLMIRWTQYTISCRQTQQITYDKDGHSTLHVAGRHNTALIIQVDTVHFLFQVDKWTQYYSVRTRRLSG